MSISSVRLGGKGVCSVVPSRCFLSPQPEFIEPMSVSHEHSTFVYSGARMMPAVPMRSGCTRLMKEALHHHWNWLHVPVVHGFQGASAPSVPSKQ